VAFILRIAPYKGVFRVVRNAAAFDIRDWFRFEMGPGINSIRLPVNPIIGATTGMEFYIDLSGTDLRMTGRPEDVAPIARGILPAADQRALRLRKLDPGNRRLRCERWRRRPRSASALSSPTDGGRPAAENAVSRILATFHSKIESRRVAKVLRTQAEGAASLGLDSSRLAQSC
jgi:hypothetical protein